MRFIGTGRAWPSDVEARRRWYETLDAVPPPRRTRKGVVEEWAFDDPRMPRAARAMALRMRGHGVLRGVCHTVALKPDGLLSECVGVHGRGMVAFYDRRESGGRVSWVGSALVAGKGRPVKMSVTQLVKLIEGIER